MDVTFNKIWECVHFNFRYTQNRTFCLLFNRPKFLSLTLYSRSIDMRQNLHFQCDTDFSLRTLHIKTIPYGCITVSIPNECFDKPYRNARHAINSLKRLFCTQLISTWLELTNARALAHSSDMDVFFYVMVIMCLITPRHIHCWLLSEWIFCADDDDNQQSLSHSILNQHFSFTFHFRSAQMHWTLDIHHGRWWFICPVTSTLWPLVCVREWQNRSQTAYSFFSCRFCSMDFN